MNRYQAEHKRILMLVDAEDWLSFSSEDELTLRALLLTGYLTAAPVIGALPSVRIRLTFKGEAYLRSLGESRRAAIVSNHARAVLGESRR